jgi:hypothetical protein
MAALPDEQREAVNMAFFDELTHYRSRAVEIRAERPAASGGLRPVHAWARAARPQSRDQECRERDDDGDLDDGGEDDG